MKITRRIKDNIAPIIVNGMSVATNSYLALYGKYLQDLVKAGNMTYNFSVGHLSDFTSAAAFSSLYLLADSFLKKPSFKLTPIGIATVWTIQEYTTKNVRDPWDVACYWAGALTAYGINKIAHIKRNKKQAENLEACLT